MKVTCLFTDLKSQVLITSSSIERCRKAAIRYFKSKGITEFADISYSLKVK